MKLLITGICGFVGSALAAELQQRLEGLEIIGLDNLSRPGSEINRAACRARGIRLLHGDLRLASDLEGLPAVDWVLEAAANPSVLAGVSGNASSRQLMEHNLLATLNVLEYCKQHRSGLILLSTSRVYSLARLAALPLNTAANAFVPDWSWIREPGLSEKGVAESFSTEPPVSLYGSAKLASELVIREYSQTFNFPSYVNRCGVMAGAGQFGKPDQGIFAYWIHSWARKRPLKYIGFNGCGLQVRDCLHPRDLAALLVRQMGHASSAGEVLNVSGGTKSSFSLAQLSAWCERRFGPHAVSPDPAPRPFDVPWMVLDSSKAAARWEWQPQIGVESILEEIAQHAQDHPDWLDLSKEA